MAETSNKKEISKKKSLKKKEKEQKRILKKEVNNKGKSFEEMIIYVDINGHFTDVHPSLQENKDDAGKKPLLKGVVTHLNEKGFGFIKEDDTNESVFFHNSLTSGRLDINDRVEFTKTKSERGFKALQLKKEY